MAVFGHFLASGGSWTKLKIGDFCENGKTIALLFG